MSRKRHIETFKIEEGGQRERERVHWRHTAEHEKENMGRKRHIDVILRYIKEKKGDIKRDR